MYQTICSSLKLAFFLFVLEYFEGLFSDFCTSFLVRFNSFSRISTICPAFPALTIPLLFPTCPFRATQVGCRFWSSLVWTRTLISPTPACSSFWMSSAKRSAGRSARSWKSKRAPRTCVERRPIREMLSRSDQVPLISTNFYTEQEEMTSGFYYISNE